MLFLKYHTILNITLTNSIFHLIKIHTENIINDIYEVDAPKIDIKGFVKMGVALKQAWNRLFS